MAMAQEPGAKMVIQETRPQVRVDLHGISGVVNGELFFKGGHCDTGMERKVDLSSKQMNVCKVRERSVNHLKK